MANWMNEYALFEQNALRGRENPLPDITRNPDFTLQTLETSVEREIQEQLNVSWYDNAIHQLFHACKLLPTGTRTFGIYFHFWPRPSPRWSFISSKSIQHMSMPVTISPQFNRLLSNSLKGLWRRVWIKWLRTYTVGNFEEHFWSIEKTAKYSTIYEFQHMQQLTLVWLFVQTKTIAVPCSV